VIAVYMADAQDAKDADARRKREKKGPLSGGSNLPAKVQEFIAARTGGA
jgi:hypothetical protein